MPFRTLNVDTDVALWARMNRLIGGDTFALTALDMAAHDLRGRRQNISTWQDWRLNWGTVPMSTYTIGLDSIEKMVAKLNEKPNWTAYKIKLGTRQDIDIVSALRQHSDAVFRVDANCNWTAQEAIENSNSLAELGVEFIEQPLPFNATIKDKARVFSESALPIIADEDCQIQSDIQRCSGLFHGVNVKICKRGGLTPALTMLREAREFAMATMVGCMIESSIGISGATQLLPLLDYADLDGAVLLKDDPAQPAAVINGAVTLSQRGCRGELIRNRLDKFRI